MSYANCSDRCRHARRKGSNGLWWYCNKGYKDRYQNCSDFQSVALGTRLWRRLTWYAYRDFE